MKLMNNQKSSGEMQSSIFKIILTTWVAS